MLYNTETLVILHLANSRDAPAKATVDEHRHSSHLHCA